MELKQMKDVIYQNRKKKQLTQEQLADLLNVSNKTVSKWERGLSYPDILLVPDLAKILDISINELFDTHDLKDESIVERDNSTLIKHKQSVLLSILLFIFSPVVLLIGYLGEIELIIYAGWIIGAGMILYSLINFIMSTSKFMKLINDKFYIDKYIITLKNYFCSYLLILFVPIILLLPLIFNNIIYSLLIIGGLYLLMVIVPYLILRKYKFNHNSLKDYALFCLSLLTFIIGIILMFLIEQYPYIIFITLSLIIYYIIVFSSNSFKR